MRSSCPVAKNQNHDVLLKAKAKTITQHKSEIFRITKHTYD